MIMMESSVSVVTAILSREHLLQDSIPVREVSVYLSTLSHKQLEVLRFLFQINLPKMSPSNFMTLAITV